MDEGPDATEGARAEAEILRHREELRARARRGRTRRRLAGAALLLSLVAAAVGVWLFVLDLRGPEAEDASTEAALFEDTARFVREEVTLVGRVGERYGDGVFSLAVGDRREALVLPRPGVYDETPRGTLRVTGTVRRVGVDLRPQIGGDVAVRRGDPAILATEIERADDED